ncbi:hypothetical protein C0J52_16211 [Blattella germanica]|nr:hypothetical protein C0J52_16211 [Blattella germanica]
MDRFNVLRYTIPDSLINLCPQGLKFLKFENRNVICIWFKNTILLYDDIDFNELEKRDAPSKDNHVLFLEGSIVNVLQLGDDVGMRMKLRNVIALGPLKSGFTLVKKKSERLYLDAYRTEASVVSIDKICSVELLKFAHAIVFVGLDCGHVYCVPLTDGKAVPVPKLVYSTRQPIKDILFMKDKERALYSHIGIVLPSGPMIYITSYEQKLHYRMVYLPGSAGHCCVGGDGIVTADGIDLWYSKFCWSTEGKLSVENKMVGVKGVRSVCLIPNSQLVLAVTNYLTLYCINPERATLDNKAGNFVVPKNAMTSLDSRMKDLAKLKHEISLEEKAMEAVSIGMRDGLLRNTFSIQVQLKNTSDQDYSPDIWTLFIRVNTETDTSKLEQRVRKGTSLKRCVKINIPESVYSAEISCSLVSRISEQSNTDKASWVVIPIASAVVDVSYFFSPTPVVNKSTLTKDLSNIARSYMQEEDENLDWSPSRETKEHTLLFRMLLEKAEPSEIWTAVIENCRQNFTGVSFVHLN